MTYPEGQSLSKALYERAKRSLPGGNTRSIVYMDPYPIYAVRGFGCRVWDKDDVQRMTVLITSLLSSMVTPILKLSVP